MLKREENALQTLEEVQTKIISKHDDPSDLFTLESLDEIIHDLIDTVIMVLARFEQTHKLKMWQKIALAIVVKLLKVL